MYRAAKCTECTQFHYRMYLQIRNYSMQGVVKQERQASKCFLTGN
jgi:hypothetical protein